MMLTLLAKFKTILWPLMAAVGIALFGFFMGRSGQQIKAARKEADDKDAAHLNEMLRKDDETAQRLKVVENANETANEINAISDSAVIDKLFDKYNRDK